MFTAAVLIVLGAFVAAPVDAFSHGPAVAAAIARAGSNAVELERALADVPASQRSSMEWLVAHMPDGDLSHLDADFLLAHVDAAHRAWHDAPWHAMIDEETFRDGILPYASVSERRELWLPLLRERCLPLVADAATPAEAAVKLNQRMFTEWNVRYSTERERADQSPSESMASGKASCTGLSILLIDACRSVGVPARFVGVPMWSDGSGNHSWVEIWDGERWRFTGAGEPDGSRLDAAWFTGRASGQRGDVPEHAIYAITWRRSGIAFPMVFDPTRPTARAVNVTERYVRAATPVPDGMTVLRISVRDDEKGVRVARQLEVIDQTGRVVASGVTKDERFDLNDHLELIVPAEGERTYLVDGMAVTEVRVVRTDAGASEIVLTARRGGDPDRPERS